MTAAGRDWKKEKSEAYFEEKTFDEKERMTELISSLDEGTRCEGGTELMIQPWLKTEHGDGLSAKQERYLLDNIKHFFNL